MKFTIAAFMPLWMGCVGILHAQADTPLNDRQILEIIEEHRPSRGAPVPENLKYRLGATHVNGQYHLTTEPFLIEGARKMMELGYGIIKLWFNKADGQAHGYHYNSDWNLSLSMTLKELAMHPYYREVFDMPFKVIVLNNNEGYAGASMMDQAPVLHQIEQEYYELAKYLLESYADRDLTFILSMWEGDWTMRGGTSAVSRWKVDSIPAETPIRIKNMIDWVGARQNGVSRAREAVKESKCRVYHAVEVNKVFDGVVRDMPSITTDVLPHVEVDMVSWSAYDGKSADGVKMFRGIDHLRHFMQPTPYMNGEKIVFIGEINEHENREGRTRDDLHEFCDLMMGVYFAQDIPYIFYWELYSNEPKTGSKSQNRVRTAGELKGNWLIRPDGSHGWAQEYFDWLLERSRVRPTARELP